MLRISDDTLGQIRAHAEQAYPEEGAGFLLGEDGAERRVNRILPLANAREGSARLRRYLITPQEYLTAENEAERAGLTLIGVFHSHPDHPGQPSDFDREWAQPFFSYMITAVRSGRAAESRSWRLAEDRAIFVEEPIQTIP